MDEQAPRREKRIEAAKAGRRVYIGTKPCGECASKHRYTSSGQCVRCTKDRAAEYNKRLRSLLAKAE